MKKLLVICGPTATGKTDLALYLAQKFNGEIVSADSRQVYKYMDIGTGKDLPSDSKYKFVNKKIGGYFENKKTKIWGYDLALPGEQFSVSGYSRIVKNIIRDIYLRKKLPILVGGTGLYIKSIVDGIDTSAVPTNEYIRSSLNKYSVDDLFTKLSELDPMRAASLNHSDKKNPRRLVRAIEIADFNIKKGSSKFKKPINFDSVLFIGLNDSIKNLSNSIENRIKTRLDKGFLDELNSLRNQGIDWNAQSMSALGYLHWKDYFEGRVTLNDVLARWLTDETHYAKRQMTWFKKDKRINWFLRSDVRLKQNVARVVKKWYDQNV